MKYGCCPKYRNMRLKKTGRERDEGWALFVVKVDEAEIEVNSDSFEFLVGSKFRRAFILCVNERLEPELGINNGLAAQQPATRWAWKRYSLGSCSAKFRTRTRYFQSCYFQSLNGNFWALLRDTTYVF